MLSLITCTQGLQQCGTDFTMMLTLFPGRTQKQLKNKFRKENKERPALVSKALNPKIAKPLSAFSTLSRTQARS